MKKIKLVQLIGIKNILDNLDWVFSPKITWLRGKGYFTKGKIYFKIGNSYYRFMGSRIVQDVWFDFSLYEFERL